MRTALLLLALSLAACGDDPTPPAANIHVTAANSAEPAPAAGNQAAARQEDDDDSSADAAGVLRRYYGFIAKGAWEDAAGLRADPGAAKRLEENFRAYSRYDVEVGTPSKPVASKGFLFVEVPVMITGEFRGGKPFGSTGSVTLRRPAENGGWRVFTG
jgi:hypothetical protein